jgi:beta-alanine--pyruvate transaminase
MICFAKAVTSGTVPMGGVIVREAVHDAFMQGPENAIELFHGYTYSAHPLACAAGLATLDLYREEDLFARAKRLEPRWADAAMALKGLPNVLDIRTLGLVAGIDLAPRADGFGRRAYAAMEQAFSKGEPEWGAHLADELENIVALHSAQNIAAVIVEPMAGSTGVLPAPKGYLKRLRQICDKHNILLIFDEVITGFGRLGHAFAAERYGVIPDMICFAKGVTSGSVPMGGVIARKGIYDAFMKGPDYMVELFHGYTYSAHPLACAAGLAALDLYRDEDLFARANKLEAKWADAAMTLKGLPNVLDVRQVGLTAAVDMASKPDAVGKRGFDAMEKGFHEQGIMVRTAGDTLAVTPPLTVTEAQIGEIFDKLATLIRQVA